MRIEFVFCFKDACRKRVGRVAFQHLHSCLRDNGTFVHRGAHKMNCATTDLAASFNRAGVNIEAFERGSSEG